MTNDRTCAGFGDAPPEPRLVLLLSAGGKTFTREIEADIFASLKPGSRAIAEIARARVTDLMLEAGL